MCASVVIHDGAFNVRPLALALHLIFFLVHWLDLWHILKILNHCDVQRLQRLLNVHLDHFEIFAGLVLAAHVDQEEVKFDTSVSCAVLSPVLLVDPLLGLQVVALVDQLY